MRRSVSILLREILTAIGLLRQYTDGVTYEKFLLSTEKQDSVLRRLEIIGEAVKGIPTDLRTTHPDVPWREIAGARDLLIDEYFRVDLRMTWDMVHQDLPLLETQVTRMLDEIERAGDGDG